MTLVMATGGIDLSVGSLIAFVSAYSALALQAGYSDWLVILAMLGAGVFFGGLQGWFIAYQGLAPFIVTLAGLDAIRGLALFATNGHSFFIPEGHIFLWFGQGKILGMPSGTVLSLVIAALGVFALDRTTLARHAVGVGSNQEAVRRAGVDVRTVKLVIYILSGLSAALASFITTARLGSGSANVAVGFELTVIAAVVLGGTSLFGGR
jgi:simple sugar transport system permease protein